MENILRNTVLVTDYNRRKRVKIADLETALETLGMFCAAGVVMTNGVADLNLSKTLKARSGKHHSGKEGKEPKEGKEAEAKPSKKEKEAKKSSKSSKEVAVKKPHRFLLALLLCAIFATSKSIATNFPFPLQSLTAYRAKSLKTFVPI